LWQPWQKLALRKTARESYIVFRQVEAPHRRLVISDHDEVAKGTLRATIQQAGLIEGVLFCIIVTWISNLKECLFDFLR
jgi:hypothetical protein